MDAQAWPDQMRGFASAGYTYGLGENADDVRGVVASVSHASVAQYMHDARMAELSVAVRQAAKAISRELGHNSPSA